MKTNRFIAFIFVASLFTMQQHSYAQSYSPAEQHYIDSLNSIINNPGSHDTLKIAARYEFGESTMQLRIGYWDSIAKDCQHLIKEDVELKKALLPYIAESYNNVGYVYMNQGDATNALKYYHKSLKTREDQGAKDGIANTLNNMGMVYFSQGDVPKSLEYIHKALKMREEIGDKGGIAYSLNNIGYIYDNQGEPDKALEYYFKSLKIQEETGDQQGTALCLNNIGTIYQYQHVLSKALKFYTKSLNIYREIGGKNGEALALNNIGAVYKDQHESDKALEFYNESLKIREAIDDKQGICYSLYNIGRTYYYMDKFDEAKKYANRDLALAREVGYPENIRDAAWLLSEIYEKEGKGMPALEMHKLYMQMKDSINNEATQKATIKQQAKYQYEKQKAIDDAENEKELAIAAEQKQKQKVIIYAIAGGLALVILFAFLIFKRLQLTRKQKVIIEEQKEKVEKTNEELEIEKQNIELKALKAQINPHFIFNSLNSVQKHIIDNNKELAHDYLTKFGKIMRSTLENSEEKSIPIKDEVELLEMYVELEAKRLKNGIDFNVIIDKNIDTYNLTIPPMLLQPFIENSIKHGIANLNAKGEITLKMVQEDDNLICTITDNGIGREASAAQKERSVQTKHRSMGMEITQNRLRNIWKKYDEQHEIEIEDPVDGEGKGTGTSVKLILPLEF